MTTTKSHFLFETRQHNINKVKQFFDEIDKRKFELSFEKAEELVSATMKVTSHCMQVKKRS
jgi:hypothetical protein